MVYLLFDNPGDKGKVSFISQMIHGEVNETQIIAPIILMYL